ncbi:Unconventional myosin-Va [Eumeta japonica]|uniref:Unconventional myosin-Va n=1 Tax=Eumeta variegata TaxID=151549 RepID=A0A4C1W114_EUMVA|nr:Unconventional myosin-Va [Eumeta japonica]
MFTLCVRGDYGYGSVRSVDTTRPALEAVNWSAGSHNGPMPIADAGLVLRMQNRLSALQSELSRTTKRARDLEERLMTRLSSSPTNPNVERFKVEELEIENKKQKEQLDRLRAAGGGPLLAKEVNGTLILTPNPTFTTAPTLAPAMTSVGDSVSIPVKRSIYKLAPIAAPAQTKIQQLSAMQQELDRRREECIQLKSVLTNQTVNLKSLASSNYGSDVDIINEDGELASAYEAQKGINRQLQEELMAEKKFYSEHISKFKTEIDRLRDENEKYQNYKVPYNPRNCRSELPANDAMRRYNAPRLLLLLLRAPLLRPCDAFVTIFTAADFHSLALILAKSPRARVKNSLRMKSLDLHRKERVDKLSESCRRYKNQIRLLVNKLKEVGIDDVNDILENRSHILCQDSIARVINQNASFSDTITSPQNHCVSLEMAPVSRRKEREYLGMFEYKIQDEGKIVSKLVTDLKPKVAVTLLPGLPAYIMFMMLRHMDHVDDEPKMHRLMKSVRSGIKKTLKRNSDSIEYNALWLANMLRLCAVCVSLILGRIGRWSGREIARSVLSFARSVHTERDNESCFFVHVTGVHRFIRRYYVKKTFYEISETIGAIELKFDIGPSVVHNDVYKISFACFRLLNNLRQYSGDAIYQSANTPRQAQQCLRVFDLSEYRQLLSDTAVWIYQGEVISLSSTSYVQYNARNFAALNCFRMIYCAGFYTPRPLLLRRRVPTLHRCDAFVRLTSQRHRFMETFFAGLINLLERQLERLIVPAILEYEEISGLPGPGKSQSSPGTSAGPAKLKQELNYVLENLVVYSVDPPLICMIFKQLFYYICAYSLNQLLLRKDLCCWAKGLQIRYNISHLETWIKERLAEYGQKNVEDILSVLKPITQAVQLLQARKSMADVQSTVDMCSNLTAMQVCKILNMYTPAEEYEVKVTREFIHEIQKKMLERAGPDGDKQPTDTALGKCAARWRGRAGRSAVSPPSFSSPLSALLFTVDALFGHVLAIALIVSEAQTARALYERQLNPAPGAVGAPHRRRRLCNETIVVLVTHLKHRKALEIVPCAPAMISHFGPHLIRIETIGDVLIPGPQRSDYELYFSTFRIKQNLLMDSKMIFSVQFPYNPSPIRLEDIELPEVLGLQNLLVKI